MKKIYLLILSALLALPSSTHTEPLVSNKTVFKGALGISSLIIVGHGIKTYWIYYTYQQLPTYKEKVNFLINHKAFLKRLLIVRSFSQRILGATVGESATLKIKLTNWLEKRLLKHLANQKLSSVSDLPFVERQVIKAIYTGTNLNQLFWSKLELW